MRLPGDKRKRSFEMKAAKSGRQVPLSRGMFGNTRRAWVELSAHVKAVLAIAKAENSIESGNEVIISLNGTGSGRAAIRLTLLTEAELIALKGVIDMAFEMARDTCRERDAVAEAALEQGNTSYTRCFRPRPTLWQRAGKDFEAYGGDLPDVPFNQDGDEALIDIKTVGKFSSTPEKHEDILGEDDSKPYGVG